MVIIGTIPIIIIGLIFRSPLESLYANPLAVGIALIGTGCYLFATWWIKPTMDRGIQDMTWKDALLIGTMQGVAIIPGVSRSGTTIATGLFAGLDKEIVTRYSFLLFIPAIIGATVLTSIDAFYDNDITIEWAPTIAGMVSAMIVGYFAIEVLIEVIKKSKLYLFSFYCWAVGIVVVILELYY